MTTGSNSDRSATGATLSASFNGATGTISETGFVYGTSSDIETLKSNGATAYNNVNLTSASGEFTKAISGLTANTTYYYLAYVKEYNESTSSVETRYASSAQSFTTKAVATASVTTLAATGIGSNTVTLNGSFSGANGTIYDRGFRYRVSGSNNQWTTVGLNSTTGTSGNFSANVGSLSENTTYEFQAYVVEWDENAGEYVDRWAGNTLTFTTLSAAQQQASGWLELPSYTTSGMAGTTTSSLSDLYLLTHKATMGGKQQRNYTCLYDPEMYASYWVAYPLCSAHLGSGSLDNFTYDPDVPNAKQTNLTQGAYGVSMSTANYSSNHYSRGHQIPNADRNGVSAMQAQTYYITNMTPQIQYGFNSPLWSDLEDAVRAQTSKCDTVYVVTGAAFRKKGGSETVNTITNTRDSKVLPVPNYYWKVMLKVTRSGNGSITGASAIGVWIPHGDLKGHAYTEYVYNVNQIEQWTGLDLFPNLPDSIEETAESNSSWSSFNSSSNIASVQDNNWGTL